MTRPALLNAISLNWIEPSVMLGHTILPRCMHLAAALVLTLGFGGATAAAEPTGRWAVANGHAHVKIAPCGEAYYGIIDWSARPEDLDKENPDPTKRTRTILGSAILLDMKQSGPNEWSGEVYNAENGKKYQASISLVEPDVLRLKGCVLGGLFCGSQNWTRVKEDAPAPAATTPGRPQAAPSPGPTTSSPPKRAAAPPARNAKPVPAAPEVCPS